MAGIGVGDAGIGVGVAGNRGRGGSNGFGYGFGHGFGHGHGHGHGGDLGLGLGLVLGPRWLEGGHHLEPGDRGRLGDGLGGRWLAGCSGSRLGGNVEGRSRFRRRCGWCGDDDRRLGASCALVVDRVFVVFLGDRDPQLDQIEEARDPEPIGAAVDRFHVLLARGVLARNDRLELGGLEHADDARWRRRRSGNARLRKSLEGADRLPRLDDHLVDFVVREERERVIQRQHREEEYVSENHRYNGDIVRLWDWGRETLVVGRRYTCSNGRAVDHVVDSGTPSRASEHATLTATTGGEGVVPASVPESGTPGRPLRRHRAGRTGRHGGGARGVRSRAGSESGDQAAPPRPRRRAPCE